MLLRSVSHNQFCSQEPILRLLNLQLQRQRGSKLGRFFQNEEKNICIMHQATRGVVNFDSVGAVTYSRRVGSRYEVSYQAHKIVTFSFQGSNFHTWVRTLQTLIPR
jgi:hypothetical protein